MTPRFQSLLLRLSMLRAAIEREQARARPRPMYLVRLKRLTLISSEQLSRLAHATDLRTRTRRRAMAIAS